jgi:ribonuclease III
MKSVEKRIYFSDYLHRELLGQKSHPTKEDLISAFTSYPEVRSLVEKLDISISNPNKWVTTFIHRSFHHEHPILPHNEKLEFLGDSILNTVVVTEIIDRFPYIDEGDGSKLKGSLVCEEMLYKLALFLELDSLIIIGKGEWKNRGYKRESIISDSFEALVGSIYLEHGFEKSREVLLKIFEMYSRESGNEFFDLDRLDNFDVKSRLQEFTMGTFQEVPEYRAEEVKDKRGKVRYRVTLIIDGKTMGTEEGISKKSIEKSLAQKALTKLIGD